MAPVIRRAAVAGSWYPATAAALRSEVESHLADVDTAPPVGRLVGLIVPHAGLVYSGPVAAHAYALLRTRPVPPTVVLVGPSHHCWFEGVAAVTRGSFETPLGRVPIDEDLVAALLAASPSISAGSAAHSQEHSLEMQLPFLQHLLPELRIVPLLMGAQSRVEVSALAAALVRVLTPGRALLVASSDLSHYLPAAVAQRRDAQVIARVEAFDSGGLMNVLEAEPDHACGGGPIVAVMQVAAALGADHAQVLRYADSGDVVHRDKRRVVGYLAAALLAPAA